MQSHTVGFVGGGRITAILLHALGGRGLTLDRVTVSDTSAEVLEGLKERFSEITASADNGEAAACERVFLALHPPALKAVLPGLASRVKKDAVVVSLAPVVTLVRLSEMLGGFRRLARVVPNAPSLVGVGFNPVAFAEGLPANARAELETLLDGLGAHPVVP
jgi:pyrroline-5-carboxylate reductase